MDETPWHFFVKCRQVGFDCERLKDFADRLNNEPGKHCGAFAGNPRGMLEALDGEP